MKSFLAVLAALVLLPSWSLAGPRGFSRSVRSSGGHAFAGRSYSGGHAGVGTRSSFRTAGSARYGFRSITGGRVAGGAGGTDGPGTTPATAPAPTYAMIGATIHSPGMFSTQTPIVETRGFQYVEAGGVHYNQPAINQSVDYSRGVFTDSTLSYGGSGSSGGYGTLFASH